MTKPIRAELPDCSILVVEEDAAVHRLVKRVCSAEPGRIRATSRGASALKIAARTRLDLVILGAQLSDLSGTDVLRRLREFDTEVPVIMVSTSGSGRTLRTAMELGAFDYLSKPLDEEEMRQVVSDALALSTATPIRLGA